MKPITSYELRKSPENKIVIVKLNKKDLLILIGSQKM